jgi:hypothetical protein
MSNSLQKLVASKLFGWGCLIISLFLLLTAPLVLVDFFKSVSGWFRWPIMAFGLCMRVLFIYIFSIAGSRFVNQLQRVIWL